MIVADNRIALDGAAACARSLGMDVAARPGAGSGKRRRGRAALAGTLLARRAAAGADGVTASASSVCCGEGRPRWTFAAPVRARGGRCQELALAAAGALAGCGNGVAFLAAGTDGRDGPTNAAGAVVDGTSWARMRAAKRDPDDDLAHHQAYDALDAAGLLLRTGPTGTNVMDVMIGLYDPGAHGSASRTRAFGPVRRRISTPRRGIVSVNVCLPMRRP